MSTSKEAPPALTLVFSPHTRCAGDTLDGEVQIYFPALMEDGITEVHVKLRGSLYTRVEKNRANGQGRSNHRSSSRTVWLARETVSIWNKGHAAYPPPGTHILTLPFRFVLPPNLLPSIDYSAYRKRAVVGYLVEVVGERPGVHFNRRIASPFPVLPISAQGGSLSSVLRTSGWTGGFRVVEQNEEMRRGIFGDYAHVHAKFVLPDMEQIPVFSPVPFSLNIVTVTKMMKFEDTPEDGPIFPEPPLDPGSVEFTLERKVAVRAGTFFEDVSWWHTEQPLGGLGSSQNPHFHDNIEVVPTEKVWIPSSDAHDEKKKKGQWKQETTFKSYFTLRCPPSFHASNMDVWYKLNLKIGFPGMGNNVKFELPLDVVSCMSAPASGGWTGPPPVLDLPPAYFNSTEDWNHDEKGDD